MYWQQYIQGVYDSIRGRGYEKGQRKNLISFEVMLLNLKNEYDKEKFKQYANRLYEKGALVEISEKKPLRSLAQNNYLHLIIGYCHILLEYIVANTFSGPVTIHEPRPFTINRKPARLVFYVVQAAILPCAEATATGFI